MDFVHLKPWTAGEQFAERAFPLRAWDAVKPTILDSLPTLIRAAFIGAVEAVDCFCVNLCEPLGFSPCHRNPVAPLSSRRWARLHTMPLC
jgi:hypothetical protein